MNFIDKIIIRKNPNIIDTWNKQKINEEIIDYAITNGYKFNVENIRTFKSYLIYQKAFKNEPSYIEHMKNNAKKIGIVTELYEIYEKQVFIEILKQDNELAKIAVKSTDIEQDIIIQIIDGNNELIDFAIKNHIPSYTDKSFANFISTIRTPQELSEMGVNRVEFNKAFIETANPEKIKQLLQDKNQNVYKEYREALERVIKENFEQFIPHLEELDELSSKQIINEEIKERTMLYLKQNNIIYNSKIPKFALEDDEYVLWCLQKEPVLMEKITNEREVAISFEQYPEIVNKIASIIRQEQAKFQMIPSEYQNCKQIYESIIEISPELLEDKKNRKGLEIITKDMEEQDVVDYYKSIKFPFNADTVDENNFYMVLECLKNDYTTLAYSKKEFTVEQYQQIYEVLKDSINPEEILSSEFLTQNPYFVMDLLSKEIDLEEINLQETRNYEQFYPTLKAISIKNGKEIPEPKDYKDIIKFKGNTIYASLDNLDSIKKGLEYLRENELEEELNIELEQAKRR